MTQRTIRSIIADQELVTAAATTTVSEAARLMREHRVGAVMVVEDGKLVGVFTERDALFRIVAEERDGRTTQLAAVMTRNPQTIHPDKPFAHALQMMYGGKFRHVPVVEDGRPIGMVSARDALGPELEAFVYELLRQEQIGDILA
jgi:CBS domain-containing protein